MTLELSRDKKLQLLKHILRNSRRKGDCLICYLGLDNRNRSTVTVNYGNYVYKGYKTTRIIMHLLYDFPLNTDSELFVLHRDELCNSKACIEPDHLKIGTLSENSRDMRNKYGLIRRTKPYYCVNGHARIAENLYKDGGCKACIKDRADKRYQQLKESKK